MIAFEVPKREEVSEANQHIFDRLQKQIGMVPNLYAALAYNETALADFLTFDGRKSTLHAKEKEVVNLAVSQVNGCTYCLSAHTALAKNHGFSDEQIMEIRSGSARFDDKLDALAKFAKDLTINRGTPNQELLANLFDRGYDKAGLVDIIFLIAGKTITNFLHQVTDIPIDFPLVPELEITA